MRGIFAAGLIAAVTVAEPMHPREFDFIKWISQWNRSYNTREEYFQRFENWLQADAFIQEVNDPDSVHTHTAGHNKFSDWTRDEFSALFNKPMTPEERSGLDHHVQDVSDDWTPTNSEINWAGGDCVTPVKNQGNCGSCYAFSATETVESAYCLHGSGSAKTLYVLSPQQIVDCSQAYGNQGCQGGWYFYAWRYLETHGQELEADYPYVSGNTGYKTACTYNSSEGKVKCTNGGQHIASNENAIMDAIDKQPVSVGVEANSWVFQTYSSGVITQASCGTSIDHAIQATGYNSGTNPPYYIVRNSWGESWGDRGYVNIEMTSSGAGICGINQMVYTVNTAAW